MEGKINELFFGDAYVGVGFEDGSYVSLTAIYCQYYETCEQKNCAYCGISDDPGTTYYRLTMNPKGKGPIDHYETDLTEALGSFCGAVVANSDEFRRRLADLVLTKDEKRRRKEVSI